MNYRFDIEEWLPKIPLRPRQEYSPEWDLSKPKVLREIYQASMTIESPRDICNNEQLRREINDQIDWGPPAPVDIFIMADGEPENRWVTKIGGLPYRPASLPWPKSEAGEPLYFLAQFDLTDSLDITGKLPGDVLLFFSQGQDVYECPHHFEWQPLGLKDLVNSDSIPYEQPFRPCFGHVFRTANFPSAVRISNGDPLCRGNQILYWDYLLSYQGIQIGPGPVGDLYSGHGDTLPGKLLCSVSGVYSPARMPYPFVNRPDPLPDPFSQGMEAWKNRPRYLEIGDLGCIYFSMDEAGDLYADWSYSGG